MAKSWSQACLCRRQWDVLNARWNRSATMRHSDESSISCIASTNWQVRPGTTGCRQPSRVSNKNDPDTVIRINRHEEHLAPPTAASMRARLSFVVWQSGVLKDAFERDWTCSNAVDRVRPRSNVVERVTENAHISTRMKHSRACVPHARTPGNEANISPTSATLSRLLRSVIPRFYTALESAGSRGTR